MKTCSRLLLAVSLGLPLASFPGAKAHAIRPAPARITRSAPAGPITQLLLNSESGDYIGGGENYSYGSADGSFSTEAFDFTGDGLVDYIKIKFASNSGQFWELDFGTNALGKNLAVGIYNQSQNAVFAPAGSPGLSVDGLGHGCDRYVGRFAILDAAFDYSSSPPAVISFAAEFEQHCEDNSAGLIGAVYLNSTPTTTIRPSQTGIEPGATTRAKVFLPSPAPPGGALVTLMSVDPTAVTVPASVTIHEGKTKAKFSISSTGSEGPRTVPILAFYNGGASYVAVEVSPPSVPFTRGSLQQRTEPSFGPTQNYLLTTKNGIFDVMASSSRSDKLVDTVGIIYRGNQLGSFWELFFSTEELTQPLVAGSYTGAQQFPNESAGQPGLSVSGDGVACDTSTGSFTVLSDSFDYTFLPAKVINFAADFQQVCPTNPQLITKGKVYYNYSTSTQ